MKFIKSIEIKPFNVQYHFSAKLMRKEKFAGNSRKSCDGFALLACFQKAPR